MNPFADPSFLSNINENAPTYDQLQYLCWAAYEGLKLQVYMMRLLEALLFGLGLNLAWSVAAAVRRRANE
jgi:hypothetical protein